MLLNDNGPIQTLHFNKARDTLETLGAQDTQTTAK